MRGNLLGKSLRKKGRKKKILQIATSFKKIFFVQTKMPPWGKWWNFRYSIKLRYISQVYYILKNPNKSFTLAVFGLIQQFC